MSISEQKKIQHLHLRAGFGMTPEQYSATKDWALKDHINDLFKKAKVYSDIKVLNISIFNFKELKAITKEERAGANKESYENIKQININWFKKMQFDEGQLREKMVLFWHNHFASHNRVSYFAQLQHNAIRKHALGSFRDLLFAVCKDPGMVQFLNQTISSREHPNERFARDLLGLFTLGPGAFNESDVKNVSKALTGWTVNDYGQFQFNSEKHDNNPKVFLNTKGNFNGDNILSIILNNKQTAKHITTKIYQFFVNEKINDNLIEVLAEDFFKSNYDISRLMKNIFSSEWFYSPDNIGNRIKSPVELMVHLGRIFGIEMEDTRPLVFFQKVLGQVLFYPPNNSGWPSNKNWIDGFTLMIRLRLPEFFLEGADVNFFAKEDGDVNTEFLSDKEFDNIQAKIAWEPLEKLFSNELKIEELIKNLANFLIQPSLSEKQIALIKKVAEQCPKELLLRNIATRLACLPEFQLC